ncbi:uncharacterized protein N7503_011282 [Penicillium pulvis]|uniref:uncharacterized protein n=1 Tax=Penicillium pulvis TaxID=1562058 RepID=UPI0025467A6B|nr:uncharacterized protein N7503_011282 [Penicillium pulvis]KAJ5786070.1 hypothetical protein N7503_011282 [Penicillium pulvis]
MTLPPKHVTNGRNKNRLKRSESKVPRDFTETRAPHFSSSQLRVSKPTEISSGHSYEFSGEDQQPNPDPNHPPSPNSPPSKLLELVAACYTSSATCAS